MAKPDATKHYDKMFYIDRFVVTRLQTGNWSHNPNEEVVEEIGNDDIIETIIDPNIPTTVNLNANDWGSVDLLSQVMNTNGLGTGDAFSAADLNGATIYSDDVKYQLCDILVRVRNNKTGFLDRSVYIPSCFITQMSWSYSVDANATEQFTFKGNTDIHLFGKYKQASIDVGTYASATTFSVNIDEATATYTGLYINRNGIVYDWATAGASWAGTTVTVSGTAGASWPGALESGDRLRLLYYKTTPSNTFTMLDTPDLGAIKGSYVRIGLGDAGSVTSSTNSLRIQSVNITSDITRDEIKELGNYQIVGNPMTRQELSVEASVLETDLEEYALMLGATSGEWSTRATNGLSLKLQDSIGNAQVLYVSVHDDYAHSNLLKLFTATNLRLTASPFTQDVGANGQLTLSLKGSTWNWAGQGDTSPRIASAYPTSYPYTGA